MPWYETWFGSEVYDLVYAHRDEDDAKQLIDLLEDEIDPSSGAHILDVGCGRGRHARILARRGYAVTGLDLSAESIAEARRQARQSGLDVTFEVGDMRDPYCSACADGVVNLFTSFGYFDDDAENLEALRAMSTALQPGGWFFQDFLNAPHVRATLEPNSTQTVKGRRIHEHRWIENERTNKEIVVERNDTTETFEESVRLFTRDDLSAMYDSVGLDLIRAYGDYDGAPYTSESPRLLLYARKASD